MSGQSCRSTQLTLRLDPNCCLPSWPRATSLVLLPLRSFTKMNAARSNRCVIPVVGFAGGGERGGNLPVRHRSFESGPLARLQHDTGTEIEPDAGAHNAGLPREVFPFSNPKSATN